MAVADQVVARHPLRAERDASRQPVLEQRRRQADADQVLVGYGVHEQVRERRVAREAEPRDDRRGAVGVARVSQVGAGAEQGGVAGLLVRLQAHQEAPAAVPRLDRLVDRLVADVPPAEVGIVVLRPVIAGRRLDPEPRRPVAARVLPRVEHPVTGRGADVAQAAGALLAAGSGDRLDRQRNRPPS